MSWLNRILGASRVGQDVPSPSTGFFDLDGHPIPLSLTELDDRNARELVRDAARRTTDAFGIPSNWLAYEVLTIADDEKAYFQLQINLRMWDELLWAQSSAFEQQVIKRIRESDVNVARAVRAVLWRILPDAGCPYDELSTEAAWRPEAIKMRASAYERVRSEFGANPAVLATLPSFVTTDETGNTLPVAQVMREDFRQTHPTQTTGFANTEPFDPEKIKR